MLFKLLPAWMWTFPFKVNLCFFLGAWSFWSWWQGGSGGSSFSLPVIWNRESYTLIDGFHELGENPGIFKDMLIGRVSSLNIAIFDFFVLRTLLPEIIIIEFLPMQLILHSYRCWLVLCKNLMVFCGVTSSNLKLSKWYSSLKININIIFKQQHLKPTILLSHSPPSLSPSLHSPPNWHIFVIFLSERNL